MNCPKCGNVILDNAKYCGQCGSPIETSSSQTSPTNNTSGSKIGLIVILVFFVLLIFIGIPIALILFFIFSFTNGSFSLDYYDEYVNIHGEKIITLHGIDKDNLVCSYSIDDNFVQYDYCDGEITGDEISAYRDRLLSENNFYIYKDSENILSKNLEDGSVFTIMIFEGDSYTIQYFIEDEYNILESYSV